MNIPRIVIAGTNSGCGKTTLSLGIMAALVKRGLKVQPFKVGPDYIDPMFHSFITGSSSRNLDSWMLDKGTAAYLFEKNTAGADIAVIEGVMGIYDGFGGYSEEGSTAEVAKLIGSPVVLVVNGEGLSLSAAALIRGFADFDKKVDFKGVIINNIKGEQHFQLLKDVIEENTGLVVVGYLPKMKDCSLESRHLGLVPSEEIHGLRKKVELLSEQVEKTVHLEMLFKLAGEAEEVPTFQVPLSYKERGEVTGKKVRIGVARDKAFNFYYKDNFDLLEMLGAELVFFSPLYDSRLPEGVDGLYIGGGYPEIWAGELQENTTMKEDIKGRIQNGLPVYAECGGLMYLSEGIKVREGNTFDMVGAVRGRSEMTSSLKRFGYVEVEALADSIIAQKGDKIRAHEFHYSVTETSGDVETCFKVVKHRRNREPREWRCGYKTHRAVAGYPHLHLWSNVKFAERFIENCRKNGEYV